MTSCFAAIALAGCAEPGSGITGEGGSGGTATGEGGSGGGATGGVTGTGGIKGTGGITATGGITGTGGIISTGGVTGTGGIKGTGGNTATGGTTGTGGATGGTTGTGGAAGAKGTGGSSTGGTTGTGGLTGTGGIKGTGGATGGTPGTGGAAGAKGTGGTTATGGTGGASVTCGGTLPTGGTAHSGNSQGTAGGLSWSLWSNGGGGSITTFGVPAFSASWNNSGDFLARTGMQWGNGKAYTSLGTVTAQFDETKSGSAGGYSYIGIYGWSTNPCIEWYIVDDSYNKMPVNPGSTTNKGTVMIDGGTYTMYLRPTTGTGGNRCGSSVTSWNQFYSVRQTARTCGQISISQHFDAWNSAGMTLGSVLEASILIEAGGGSGSINFPTANVTAQ